MKKISLALAAVFSLCLVGWKVADDKMNAYFGDKAGSNNDRGKGTQNAGFGGTALMSNVEGSGNSAFGFQALFSNQGSSNTALGGSALQDNTAGNENVAIGGGALYRNSTGVRNIGVGTQAGWSQTTGKNNIYIGNKGAEVESGQIKIGTKGEHTQTTIAGIHGNISSSGLAVYVNADGQLGTQMSSLRFKEAIHDIGNDSKRLMTLRPVAFRYRTAAGGDGKTREYGLIAEEVAKTLPELAVYDDKGKPSSVRYHLLTPLLLNELQKQQHKMEEQAAVIAAQSKQLTALTARLERLESR